MPPAPADAETALVLRACRDLLASADVVELGDEYFYASLPLCVIDAVYSIGVRYASVRNVIRRYCAYAGVTCFCATRGVPPPRAEQESISAFVSRLRGHSDAELALTVFGNQQRTSTRSGILKAGAVRRFAEALALHRIETLQDIRRAADLAAIERDVRRVPGQTSGISWSYFLMLAGREDLVKPDRRILGFLSRALGRPARVDEARFLLAAAARELQAEFPGLEPRTLDHVIWKRESGGEIGS
jgi:hypothetical protein